MGTPVKERVMVFFFKVIKEELLDELNRELGLFFKTNFGEANFNCLRINIPSVTGPGKTEGDDEPDWTRLKVSVDRLYRYKTSDGRFMFQLARDFFSINALDRKDGDLGACSGKELGDFYERTKDFLVSVLSKKIKVEDAHYDMIYVLKQESLLDFLEQPRTDGSYGYYNIFKLFANLGEGTCNDDWGFVSPLEQHFLFKKREDEKCREVEMNIKAGANSKNKWYLEMKTACYSHTMDSITDSMGKIAYMFNMISDFESDQNIVIRRVFSKDATNILSV